MKKSSDDFDHAIIIIDLLLLIIEAIITVLHLYYSFEEKMLSYKYLGNFGKRK